VEAGQQEAALDLFFRHAFAEPGTQKVMEGARLAWAQLPPETVRNFFSRTLDLDLELRPLLRLIACPTLVFHGEKDLLCPLEAGEYVARHIPGARFHVLKGRCHVAHITATTEYVSVMRQFIRGDPAPGGADPAPWNSS
jgi:pimeloyl-[acyl-carrier protein] methyl ester esterase